MQTMLGQQLYGSPGNAGSGVHSVLCLIDANNAGNNSHVVHLDMLHRMCMHILSDGTCSKSLLVSRRSHMSVCAICNLLVQNCAASDVLMHFALTMLSSNLTLLPPWPSCGRNCMLHEF